MKRILSLLILLTTLSYSQKGDAVLILKDSTIIKGYGEITGIHSIKSIKFGNDSLKFRTYKSKELLGIDILENDYYRKFRYKKIENEKFSQILEIISIDNLSVYCRIYEDKDDYSLPPVVYYGNGHVNYDETFRPNSTRDQKSLYIGKNKKGESIIPRISYYIGNYNDYKVRHLYTKGLPFSKSFKKSMIEYFKDCKDLIEKVKNKEYTKEDIFEVIEYYKNNCYNL